MDLLMDIIGNIPSSVGPIGVIVGPVVPPGEVIPINSIRPFCMSCSNGFISGILSFFGGATCIISLILFSIARFNLYLAIIICNQLRITFLFCSLLIALTGIFDLLILLFNSELICDSND